VASAQSIRAGEAVVELSADDSRFRAALDRMKDKMARLGSFFRGLGGSIAGMGGMLAAPLAAAVPVMNSLLDQSKLAAAGDAFGMTAEQASRLFGIMGSAGSDIRDATEGLVTLNQRVADAMSGTGKEAKELFEGLGVAASEFEGLDTAERFYKLHAALLAVEDPAQRVQLLLKSVGEDTGKNLIPLLSMSSDEVRNLGASFETSAEDMKRAKAAAKEYTAAVGLIKGVWSQVVAAVAPIVTEAGQAFGKLFRPVVKWIKDNRELVTSVGRVVAVVGGVGVALTTLGLILATVGVAVGGFASALGVASGAVGVLTAAVGLLLTPLGGIALAVGAGVVAFLRLSDTGQRVMKSLGDVIGRVAAVFQAAFGGIVAAVKKGELELAFDIAAKSINVAWLTLLERFRSGWNTFVNFFRDSFRDAAVAIQKIGLSTASVLQTAFLRVLVEIIDKINKAHAMLPGVETEEQAKARVQGTKEFQDLETEHKDLVVKVRRKIADADSLDKRIADRDVRIREALGANNVEKANELIAVQNTEKDARESVGRNIDEMNERIRVNQIRQGRIVERAQLGAKFIDPEPFRSAANQIEKDTARVIKSLEEVDKKEREARNLGQQQKLNEVIEERLQLERELAELLRRANAPEPNVAPMPRVAGAGLSVLPVAPMPRERPAADRFGDAARGLFQSADFRGALSIGPPAKLEEIGRDQLTVLREIRDGVSRIEPGVFT
jgi:hypothetical protein